VRLRLLSSPWWIRWLAITCLSALAIAVVVPFAAPSLIHALRWPWSLVLLAFASVALGGLWAFVTEPQHRFYLAALQGLSTADQRRAVGAIRRGDMPGTRGMSDRSVAKHIEQIAELSTQAVAVVRDARADDAAADQDPGMAAYQALSKAITDEEWVIVDVCRISVRQGR
jgi:hypothetical protein